MFDCDTRRPTSLNLPPKLDRKPADVVSDFTEEKKKRTGKRKKIHSSS